MASCGDGSDIQRQAHTAAPRDPQGPPIPVSERRGIGAGSSDKALPRCSRGAVQPGLGLADTGVPNRGGGAEETESGSEGKGREVPRAR